MLEFFQFKVYALNDLYFNQLLKFELIARTDQQDYFDVSLFESVGFLSILRLVAIFEILNFGVVKFEEFFYNLLCFLSRVRDNWASQ